MKLGRVLLLFGMFVLVGSIGAATVDSHNGSFPPAHALWRVARITAFARAGSVCRAQRWVSTFPAQRQRWRRLLSC